MDGEVRTAYLVNHIDGLTSGQISHWINSGWLQIMKGEGYDTFKTFRWDQFMKAKYMAYLVNKLGFTPKAASDIADLVIKRESLIRGRIWVTYGEAAIGIPDLGEN